MIKENYFYDRKSGLSIVICRSLYDWKYANKCYFLCGWITINKNTLVYIKKINIIKVKLVVELLQIQIKWINIKLLN